VLRSLKGLLLLSFSSPVHLAFLTAHLSHLPELIAPTETPRFPHRSDYKGKANKLRHGLVLPIMEPRAELERLISFFPTAATKQRASLTTPQGCNNMVKYHYHSLISRISSSSPFYPSSKHVSSLLRPQKQGYRGQQQSLIFAVEAIWEIEGGEVISTSECVAFVYVRCSNLFWSDMIR
jgi:hypothetical protein